MRTQTKTVVTGHTISANVFKWWSNRKTVPRYTIDSFEPYPIGYERFMSCYDEDGNEFTLPITEHFLQELMPFTGVNPAKIEMEIRIVSE